MGGRLLSSTGTGKNCALSMRFPDRSPALDKNRAPMGPEILSSTGAGAWRKAPMAFPDSSSVLDKFQSARQRRKNFLPAARWGETTPNNSVSTICPETITELIRFEFLRCKNYVTAPEIIGSEQKRPGANRPPEFVPANPLQERVFGSHIFSKEL